MVSKIIPDIVVGRLPVYLQALVHLQHAGQKTTSSQDLGEQVGISAAQIRKDLSLFGEFGKQGTGYAIEFLIEQIQGILNVNRKWEIALVGAGDLGRAIAHYSGFTDSGFHVTMVFDIDPEKVGKKIGKLTVENSSQMVEKIRAAGIQIAMLTVPGEAAQQVADDLVKAGVKAIQNYAPVTLKLPPGVRVENIDPLFQLQHMTYYLK